MISIRSKLIVLTSMVGTLSSVLGLLLLLNAQAESKIFPVPARLVVHPDSSDDTPNGYREWTSANGKHSRTAKMISCVYPEIVLEQKDSVQLTVQMQSLSKKDQKLAFKFAGYDCELPDTISVSWLKRYEAEFVHAKDALAAMSKVFEKAQMDANSKLFLTSRLKTLRTAAGAGFLRCFDEYEPLAALNSKRVEGNRKLDEILAPPPQLSDGKFISECLEESVAIDPVSVEGLFLIGIVNMFCDGGTMTKAEKAFEEVLKRCKLYEGIFATEDWGRYRVYAMNNLAMIQIRDLKIKPALVTMSGISKELADKNLRIASNVKRLNWLAQNKGFRSNLERRELEDIVLISTTLESGTSVPVATSWAYLFPSSVDQGILQRIQSLKLFIKGIGVEADYISDPLCLNCKGAAMETCVAKGCRLGKVRLVDQGYAGAGLNPGKATRVQEVACSNCRGDGKVVCPCCIRGIQKPR